jgi:hypothetical protein
MELFRPSWVQDSRLLFHMYTRGIFTESKPKECNLLAAITFCSEKCKATLIRPFTYIHGTEAARNQTGFAHEIVTERKKATRAVLCIKSLYVGCLTTAKHIRLLTTRKCSVKSNGSDLQAQSHGM